MFSHSQRGRGRGRGRGGNYNNPFGHTGYGSGQRIDVNNDMWFVIFVHKLMFEEIPQMYKGLTIKKQNRQIVIQGPRAQDAKHYILNYLKQHFMTVFRFDIWTKIDLLNPDYLSLKRSEYFQVIQHRQFNQLLELVKNQFGNQPVKFIEQKLLQNKKDGFTIIFSKRNKAQQIQNKINDLCGAQRRQHHNKNKPQSGINTLSAHSNFYEQENDNTSSQHVKKQNNQQICFDFSQKQLFLALTLEESLKSLKQYQFQPYVQMENLYIKGESQKCRQIISTFKQIVSKWDLLVFYLKYNIDTDFLKQSLPKTCQLKIMSSVQMIKQAHRLNEQFQTDIFQKIIKKFKLKGDYLVLIFLKQFSNDLQKALLSQVSSKLAKQNQQQINTTPVVQQSLLNSIYSINVDDFDESDFLNFSHQFNIEQEQLSIVKEKDIKVIPNVNVSKFTKQSLDNYFKNQRFIFLKPEQEKLGNNFVIQMSKKYPRVTISQQIIFSQFSMQEIDQSEIKQQIERNIYNNNTDNNQINQHKIACISISGINNLCDKIITQFNTLREEQMKNNNINMDIWKVIIPQLIKYNLNKDSVRTLVQNRITQTINQYQKYDIKIQQKKPQRQFAFSVSYKKDLDVEEFKNQFSNLIQKNLITHHIKEFSSTSQLFNINQIHKVGIFAENQGDLYLIGFQSLDNNIKQLEEALKKQIVSISKSYEKNNYFNIIKEVLENARTKQSVEITYSDSEDQKIVNFKGYQFKIKRLQVSIQKIINEAKKSLDFDLMYINNQDKYILQTNGVLQNMRKSLQIAITVEQSNQKIFHIDLQNNNRITITTCDIEKYQVLFKLTHDIEQIGNTTKDTKPQTLYDSDKGLMYIDSTAIKSPGHYIEKIYQTLQNNRSQCIQFAMNISAVFQLQKILNSLIVFLGKNKDKEHVHICLTKEDKKSWEDVYRKLKSNKLKTTKQKNVIEWYYQNNGQMILFEQTVSQKIEKSLKQNSYKNSRTMYASLLQNRSKIQLSEEQCPIKEEFQIKTQIEQKQIQINPFSIRYYQSKTKLVQQKYIRNIKTGVKYKIVHDYYICIGQKLISLSPHIKRLIMSGNNATFKLGMIHVQANKKTMTNVLSNKQYKLDRKQYIIDIQDTTNFTFLQTKSFSEIKFQCQKSKYAYIMGAKYQIKQKIKSFKNCRYNVRIQKHHYQHSQYVFGIIDYTSISLKNNGYPLLLVKKIVDNHNGVIEFKKKGSWKLQQSVIIYAQSQQRMNTINKQLFSLNGQKSSYLQNIPLTSQIVNTFQTSLHLTIKSVQKVINPSLQKLFNNSKQRDNYSEKYMYYGNKQLQNLQQICLQTSVSFDISKSGNYMNYYLNFFQNALQCHQMFNVDKSETQCNKRQMIYCKILKGIRNVQRSYLRSILRPSFQQQKYITKSNLALPLYLIKY